MVTLDRVHSAVRTPTDYVFRDFIIEMTNKRQIASDMLKQARDDISQYPKDTDVVQHAKAKIQKGNSMKDFAKINNNSCYGKTIQ
jgi:hypothetical protein